MFLAAWAMLVGPSALVSGQGALSGTVPRVPSLLAMVTVQAIIGLVEGGITVAVIRFIERVRPAVIETTPLARAAA